MHFTAMDGDFLRRLDSQADLVPSNFHHRDDDMIVNHNAFVLFPRKHQHAKSRSSIQRTHRTEGLSQLNGAKSCAP